MIELPDVVYGVLLDQEGSCDYYESAVEAHEYARDRGLQVVKVTTEAVTCTCYMFWEPSCDIHGY